MDRIINQEKDLPKTYKVIRMERVEDYLFIETDVTSLLLDGENCYDVGKYNHAESVFTIGDDLVAVLELNEKQELVNVKTKEVIFSHCNSYNSEVFKIDDDYVGVAEFDYEALFNVHTRKFIHPQIDLNIKYYRKIGENLFHFKHSDYEKCFFQNFIVNQKGEIVYDCGASFPYFIDGNLVLYSKKEGKVIIVHDLLNSHERTDILTKNKTILSNPLVYTENNEAAGVLFVSDNKLKMINFNLEELKEFSLDVDADEYGLQLWGDIAIIIVSKGETKSNIAVNLNNGVQIKHSGIWVLPLDMPGRKVIRGCDVLGKDAYLFTLYDEDGVEYTHHLGSDCFNVHSKQENKYIYWNVDGTNKNIIYNVDTRKEQIIPWKNLRFDREDEYQSIGCGIRYDNFMEDGIIDFIDEDLNVIFGDIKCADFDIRFNDFRFDISNNLLLLTLPESAGAVTYFRQVVMDKENNVLYDSYLGNLSFVGNCLQIVEAEKTTYIDSRTMKVINEDSLLISDMGVPENLQLEGRPIKLIKK